MPSPVELSTLYEIARVANEARTGVDALSRVLDLLVERFGLAGGLLLINSRPVVRRGAADGPSGASIPVYLDREVAAEIRLCGGSVDASFLAEAASLLAPALARDRRAEGVARRLHDGLGQELTGLGFLAGSLAEELRRYPRAARKAERFAAGLRKAADRVRSMSRGLMPVDVASLGLKAALAEFASGLREFYGIPCRVEWRGDPPAADHPAAEPIYFIAQEAAANAARHSGATRIRIRVDSGDRWCRLTVADDGRGFPEGRAVAGSGLRLMRRRAAEIGASMEIAPRRGGGTRVTASVPMRG